MYTLLCNGQPVRQDEGEAAECPLNAQLELSDRFFGKEYLIPWVASNGIIIAKRALLKDAAAYALR